jgi:hypothetical protein
MSENEMGYRGSKSVNYAVKEQRVDGNWCFNDNKLLHLRCTLMAFKRKYPIKILSKQLNISSFSTLCLSRGPGRPRAVENKQTRALSAPHPYGDNLLNNTCAINPWWITGFADAEGSFQIIIRHDTRLQFN